MKRFALLLAALFVAAPASAQVPTEGRVWLNERYQYVAVNRQNPWPWEIGNFNYENSWYTSKTGGFAEAFLVNKDRRFWHGILNDITHFRGPWFAAELTNAVDTIETMWTPTGSTRVDQSTPEPPVSDLAPHVLADNVTPCEPYESGCLPFFPAPQTGATAFVGSYKFYGREDVGLYVLLRDDQGAHVWTHFCPTVDVKVCFDRYSQVLGTHGPLVKLSLETGRLATNLLRSGWMAPRDSTAPSGVPYSPDPPNETAWVPIDGGIDNFVTDEGIDGYEFVWWYRYFLDPIDTSTSPDTAGFWINGYERYDTQTGERPLTHTLHCRNKDVDRCWGQMRGLLGNHTRLQVLTNHGVWITTPQFGGTSEGLGRRHDADCNGDGAVGSADFGCLLKAWGKSGIERLEVQELYPTSQ